ncbi:MAG: histidine triad nucleotide-binding protein [Actinomycetes bacterium]
MADSPACLFCQIVAGQIPADIVRSTADTVAFRDIAPEAPIHVLVVPRTHHVDITQLAASDSDLAGRLVADAAAVATELGLDDFRMVLNTGASAGQSVFHVHAHVMAGRPFGWPPG